MTYTIYSYESRELFDRDDYSEAETRETASQANGLAHTLQRQGQWVRVYRGGEYQFYLVPKGERNEP